MGINSKGERGGRNGERREVGGGRRAGWRNREGGKEEREDGEREGGMRGGRKGGYREREGEVGCPHRRHVMPSPPRALPALPGSARSILEADGRDPPLEQRPRGW